MTQNPAASDWAAARGDKWAAQLPRIEATLVGVDAPLIAALKLDVPCRVAEVGCGGGGTTSALLRHAPAGSVVHGFDVSARLVELARQRTHAAPRAPVFEVADMATATPQAPYDRLVSRFGIMFFADPPAAFANLLRWLRPGGRFAFAVWGPQSENAWFTNLRAATARVIELPLPDPDGPGAYRYADVNKLLSLLEHSGYRELDVHEWRGALPVGGTLTAAAAAEFALASFSSFGELLAQASDAAFRRALDELTASFARHYVDGAVRLDACVRIVTGTRA